MATLADSLKTSSSRPLRLRKRPDLTTSEQRYQGRPFWVIKEPVGLKYYRFQEEEYAILEMVDGQASLDDIKRKFEQRFAPQKITYSDLQQFIGTLHRNSLVVSSASGQGDQLKRRRDERKRKELMGQLTNVLAIRFKGVDPDRVLNWLHPWTSWMFTRVALVLFCILTISALGLVLIQFDTFRSRLPAFHEFFGPQNWLLLGVILAVTKILHEFGHGLSCKRFGGECHEMGVMLLVLTPCLYCNVSDSWMLPSKWKRAAIGAAGMYVEVTLASIATFIWWYSEPGLLNHVALQIMFICSVSTVIFNGNPLLRYDGYYILSDIAEIPNLRQKSTSILNRLLAQWCLGMEMPEEPFLPQRNRIFFALYTVAAAIYRWVVLISILYFLYKVFEPYGLKVIGQMIALFSVSSMIIQPLVKLGKFFKIPGRLEQIKWPRFYVTLGVLATLLAGILLIPVPHRISCTFEIRPRDAVSVYIQVPGRLEQVHVKPGQEVAQGAALAELSNVDLHLTIAELTAQENEYKQRLDNLQRQRFVRHVAGEEVPQVQETLEAVREQLENTKTDLARLNLTAPTTGVVFPPPRRGNEGQPPGTLRNWQGTLLERKNLGAVITESEKFCEIGNPHHLEAVLVIDQTDIEFVAHNFKEHDVYIKLDAFPGETFAGHIAEISRVDMKAAPRSLTAQAGGSLATRTDASGTPQPLSTSYTASVPLDTPSGQLQVGLRGNALVYTDWQPLGRRIWRYLSHTFHFML